MTLQRPNRVSQISAIRRVYYAHVLFVICLGVLAYCELTWQLPAPFKWLGTIGWGGWIYTVLIISSYSFRASVAWESIGRIPAWRSLPLLLVDLLLGCLQLAILMVMAPIRD
jgi:hypothetical protein